MRQITTEDILEKDINNPTIEDNDPAFDWDNSDDYYEQWRENREDE